jgi:rod shape-determining protein MreC
MLGFSILSLLMVSIDHQSDFLDGFRGALNLLATPVFIVAELPSRSVETVLQTVTSREKLQAEIVSLQQELLLSQTKIEKMASLSAENARLRSLLGSSEKLEDNVLVAELVGVNPDPESHVILLDKGSSDGVYEGQSVVDAQGLMGQIIEVNQYMSRALLITDAAHSVPVQVNRNDLRLIAAGSGKPNEIELIHVQDTADIQVGDLLVSSGLGQRFPVGYPVGVVSEVLHDPGQPFAVVKATPSAFLDRSRHVLLVFKAEKPDPMAAMEEDHGN